MADRHHHHRDREGHPGRAHGHGHGHGHGATLRARLLHAFTPHSHDTADRFDSALESSGLAMRTLVWSLLALMATAAAQAAVVAATGSVALLGDTVHNFADALTAVPVGIALLLGRRAASRRFTYGLGRAEDLAGVVVVVLIAASAVLAGYEALHRLADPRPVQHLWAVAAAGVIGFAGNEVVARWRIRVGRRIGSAALVADGAHARADGFTSLAVVGGAAGVALGFPAADPLVGLAMAVAIAFVAYGAAKRVGARLLDAVDPAEVEMCETAAAAVPGVSGVSEVRMRWIGHTLRAELSVAVEAGLSVARGHGIAHEVERALMAAVPRLGAATVHVEPDTGAETAHRGLAHHG
ncbi:cation diffusion facilitator family transporter [Streptomonospora nanhaiensis]|uniref:cation diffusion facilitator family transporter n=1 Tax=Streptomonospora nanhaiensis TaxID=1323731 RepID=UPI001C99B29C|nr:cation diffusion facilitator family transporter [Streptomonospora nanhaiensis]MBX9387471.1 cation diffusion facilitator family transporter [Streptomonospora nanhaiensis]